MIIRIESRRPEDAALIEAAGELLPRQRCRVPVRRPTGRPGRVPARRGLPGRDRRGRRPRVMLVTVTAVASCARCGWRVDDHRPAGHAGFHDNGCVDQSARRGVVRVSRRERGVAVTIAWIGKWNA